MLFKLSFRNIKRSLKDYAIYFFTLIIGISLFYVFNAIESQTAMMNLSKTANQIIEMMSSVMISLSVLVAIILGLLIIYASRFLMKRRKKEFGIYMTLGMSKSQISRILLTETFVIGIFSLIVGLLIGIGLSQLMSILVANLFEADMTNFEFVFSEKAFINTIISFGVIYLIVMISNAIFTSRQKLIKLIHSDKMNEKIKIRNLPVSIVMMILAIGSLSYAYAGIMGDIADLSGTKLTILIALGCIGTLSFFWSLAGLVLRIIPKFKNFYYKNLNTFIFREINGKINTTIVSMSVICILLFFTIVVFSSAMAINNSLTKDLRELIPADFQVAKIFRNDDKTSIEEKMSQSDINIKKDFSEIAKLTIYERDDVTYNDTIGQNAIENIGTIDEEVLLQIHEDLVHVSEYNSLARLYGNEEFDLSPDEYAVVANFDKAVSARNQALRQNSPVITINNIALHPKFSEVRDGYIIMSPSKVESGTIIVPDNVDLSGNEIRSFVAGNYKLSENEDEAAMNKKIENLTSNDGMISASTKSRLYDQSVSLSAVMTFIGLYLGVIFLMTSAALLSLKELSDSSDNQEKYAVLKRLGVDQKRLNRTLFEQIAIFFCLPLLLAIVHSFFGIMFINNALLSYMASGLLIPILTTATFIVAIYGGYFLITYFTSKRIVMGKS